jgi:hypothetical protein
MAISEPTNHQRSKIETIFDEFALFLASPSIGTTEYWYYHGCIHTRADSEGLESEDALRLLTLLPPLPHRSVLLLAPLRLLLACSA